ncbi:hypothetical protein BOTBODRAFT_127969 [Botryobasidium botryosum FD-172 SS1]|uniref:Trimethylguanosine synthase n=1 Tax=Botryobasidium botryosum (strain FD-172 SS1) TaxID=930990 RepID=A0A067MTH0_BOTB1|nr:hypothetical protein BOTBODRAFT_127969 [Botryobasidium botryosum FD-172 SS1]
MGKKRNSSKPGPLLTQNIRELLGQGEVLFTNVAASTTQLSNSNEVAGARLSTAAIEPVPIYDTTEGLDDAQPKKKLKRVVVEGGFLGPGLEHHNATGLVPHYTQKSQVPPHLQKYFAQRKRYFSMYSEGCLLDEEGWFSVTPERIADQIAERCRCGTILDAFCGVGGNTIAFARTCERVIALDTSPVRLALARHNAAIYGVADRIEFILADYTSFARSYLSLPNPHAQKIDVVFLSPPWGGPSYLHPSASEDDPAPPGGTGTQTEYTLASVLPIPGDELFALTRKITPNVAYFLPRNMNIAEVGALVDASVEDAEGRKEKVEIEEEWMGNKLKALTCYFGGLALGQEWMWPQ